MAAHDGPGRPRVYCGRTCRQAAANARAGANVAPRVVTIERIVERTRTVTVKAAPEPKHPDWWKAVPNDAASWIYVLDLLWAQLWLQDLSMPDRLAIKRRLHRINRELRGMAIHDDSPDHPGDPSPEAHVDPGQWAPNTKA